MGKYWKLLGLKIVKVDTNHAGDEIRKITLTSPDGKEHGMTFTGEEVFLKLDGEEMGVV